MDTTTTAQPTISGSTTTTTLSGTCSVNKPNYPRILIDLYISDPEGDAASDPQGKTYLGTFEDNAAGDSNPTPGAFTFDISSLGLASGTKVTLTANYMNSSAPTITSISVSGSNAILAITGGNAPYNILRKSSLLDPWTSIAYTQTSPVTVAGGGNTAFYALTCPSPVVQTSPFATSFTLP